MPSSLTDDAVGAVRFLLVGGGLVVTAGAVHALMTVPPAPPGGDGFVRGMAYIVGGILLVFALAATGLGIALPSLVGTRDRLGFGPYQRRLLQGAGVLFVGGLLVGVVAAVAAGFGVGVVVLFGAVVIGLAFVGCVVVWRLGELAHDLAVRAGGSPE